jgi:hypothetical protein
MILKIFRYSTKAQQVTRTQNASVAQNGIPRPNILYTETKITSKIRIPKSCTRQTLLILDLPNEDQPAVMINI